MNILSRTISGAAFLFFGFSLGYFSFQQTENFGTFLVFGIILILLGIFILFNKNEDRIEEIKKSSKSKKKVKRK